MIRQYAINAARELRAGNIEDGLCWLVGYCEAYTDVFTSGIKDAAARGDFAEVARRLEHVIDWCL